MRHRRTRSSKSTVSRFLPVLIIAILIAALGWAWHGIDWATAQSPPPPPVPEGVRILSRQEVDQKLPERMSVMRERYARRRAERSGESRRYDIPEPPPEMERFLEEAAQRLPGGV